MRCGSYRNAWEADGRGVEGQLNANPENEILLKQALPIIDALEHRRRVDITNTHPALQSIFNPAVQGFLINAFSYNPGHLISSISKPVLVLQGQRDLQVEETDARLLKAANPQAPLVILPNMNHVMKEVTSDDRKANIATYAEPAPPLSSRFNRLDSRAFPDPQLTFSRKVTAALLSVSSQYGLLLKSSACFKAFVCSMLTADIVRCHSNRHMPEADSPSPSDIHLITFL